MSPTYDSNAPFFVAILVAVGVVFSRWLLWNSSQNKNIVAPLIGVLIGAIAVLLSYHSDASEIWNARFGIRPIWNSPQLYWGAVVEIIRIFLGFCIYVRTIGYVFNEDLNRFFGSRTRSQLIVLDVVCVAALLWISVYTFDPSYGPNSLLVESENRLAAMQKKKDSLDTDESIKFDALINTPLLCHLKNKKGTPTNQSKNFAESTNRFILNTDIKTLKQSIEDSNSPLKIRHLELLSDLSPTSDLVQQSSDTESEEESDSGDGESTPSTDGAAFDSFRQGSQRKLILEKIFRENFYLSCQKPYIYYGVYSVLAFVCIALPMFLVPLLSAPRYWKTLLRKHRKIVVAVKRVNESNIDNVSDANLQTVQQSFDDFWIESKKFVERFGELPLLCAGLVAFELAYGSDTLSKASLKISLVAAFCIMLLSFVGLLAALLVDSARKKLSKNIALYPWLKERKIKDFLDEIRSDSFVGTVATFVGGSLVVGVLMQILRLFGS